MNAQLTLFPEPESPTTPCPLAMPAHWTRRPIVLLDLNYTLVGNSPLKRRQPGLSYADKIRTETYRTWLIRLLDGFHVVLWTVRFERYRSLTLERLRALTDWQPDDMLFNPTGSYEAHEVKEQYVLTRIIPTFGPPADTPYLALESNTKTRAMLARYSIPAVKVGATDHWSGLPGDSLPAVVTGNSSSEAD